MRKFLSPAFSERSLREQEGLVTQVIDEFIDQVGQRGNSKEGVDMTMWTNLLTFDIIGELAFGESFHGLETGNLHFWIAVVLESMGQAGLSDFLKRFPTVGRIFLKLNPRWLDKLTDGAIKHQAYTIDLVKWRIQQKTSRKDFMSYLLAERNASQTSDIQLAAHASDFVRYPHILKALQEEIRSAFRSYEEINGQSTSSLKYLHATIVSTNLLAASLDPRKFDAPWSFCPERWLRLNTEDQLEASQPFSMGPRSCLGRGLAWLELRLTLPKLFYRYDLKLVDDELEWHRDVAMHLLWVKPKLMMRVLPRAKRV
ncbi:benzoate 4-monooxygenase cytochrome P450 [Aspergillus flavus AF70]|nr:benzoate 4-monooxygenase cytochrome P450 [Aspergillus flavus AF70]